MAQRDFSRNNAKKLLGLNWDWGMKNYSISILLAFAVSCSVASFAYGKDDGPTGLNCEPSQSLWIYEIGNRGSLAPPSHKDGGQSLTHFETWSAAGQSYWAARLTDLPFGITAAKTLENIRLRAGSESSPVPLGEFTADWPAQLVGSIKGTAIAPSYSSAALGFNLEIEPSSVFGTDFDGTLFYAVTAQAQLEYARLALCSNAPAPVTRPVISPPAGGGTAALTSEITGLKTQLANQQIDFTETLESLNSELETKNSALTAAQDLVSELETQLSDQKSDFETRIAALETALESRSENPVITPDINLGPENKGNDINGGISTGSSARIWQILSAVLALMALGLAGLLAFRPRSNPRVDSQNSQERAKPEKPPESGVVFPKSALVAGALAPGPAPLVPLGQMVPSGLQTLTGSYAALKPAYKATGRIGGPQEGIPTNDDVAFGTGFLITPNHVMTNQHVYEFYKRYLTGPDCGGIEFIAERDRDASDYVPFNGETPLILPGLDIAIFKLSRTVTDRKPIERVAIPTDELNEREVITISYPCPFEVDEHILSIVEKDPVFAVKRLSQGRVFRHTTDTDKPFGVQVNVDARINADKSLLAICHNASTLGGSSGAPILDKAGSLVGVHFAGDRAFNGEEAANLAMAIEMLTEVNPE